MDLVHSSHSTHSKIPLQQYVSQSNQPIRSLLVPLNCLDPSCRIQLPTKDTSSNKTEIILVFLKEKNYPPLSKLINALDSSSSDNSTSSYYMGRISLNSILQNSSALHSKPRKIFNQGNSLVLERKLFHQGINRFIRNAVKREHHILILKGKIFNSRDN